MSILTQVKIQYRLLKASYIWALIIGFIKYQKLGNDTHLDVRLAGAKGEGLYTTINRKKGDLIFIANGPAVHAHFEGDEIHTYEDWYSVDKDTWIDIRYPYIKINHSCDPNTIIDSGRCFIALRNIEKDEELTFDYSVTEDEEEWEMRCQCGASNCNGHIGPIQTIPPQRYEISSRFLTKHFKEVFRANHKYKSQKIEC